MFNKLSVFICSILLFITFVDEIEISAVSNQVIIQTDSLNVRSGAGLTYPVIAKIKKGQTFQVISEKNDWINIQLNGNKNGWVASWLVVKKSSNTTDVSNTSKTVLSNTAGLRIRSGPGTSFQVIGVFEKGKAASQISRSGDWIKISFSGTEGWVSAKYVIANQAENSTTTEKVATVKASTLNIRSKPSSHSEKIGSLKRNAKVTILKEENYWAKIRANSLIGWVHQDYLDDGQTNQTNSSHSLAKGTVTASSLNVRNSGSLNGSVVGTITKGAKVTLIEEKKDWVKISYGSNKSGWVAGWYISKANTEKEQNSSSNQTSKKQIKVIYNGTNIRSGASTSHAIVKRADSGEIFEVTKVVGDWYKLNLGKNQTGYIAGWVVETIGGSNSITKPGVEQYLKNQTIVIDPGHGGRDSGAVGTRGTLEKKLTLTTAKLVYDKLRSAGANVFLTRTNDTYISLNSRISTSHYRNANAFVSLHYDSINDRSVSGTTSYYYNSTKDGPLASKLNNELTKQTALRNRGVKFGNFHVLRENNAPSVLIELGYLSNQTEELTVKSSSYQERASQGIYNGLAHYFK